MAITRANSVVTKDLNAGLNLLIKTNWCFLSNEMIQKQRSYLHIFSMFIMFDEIRNIKSVQNFLIRFTYESLNSAFNKCQILQPIHDGCCQLSVSFRNSTFNANIMNIYTNRYFLHEMPLSDIYMHLSNSLVYSTTLTWWLTGWHRHNNAINCNSKNLLFPNCYLREIYHLKECTLWLDSQWKSLKNWMVRKRYHHENGCLGQVNMPIQMTLVF